MTNLVIGSGYKVPTLFRNLPNRSLACRKRSTLHFDSRSGFPYYTRQSINLKDPTIDQSDTHLATLSVSALGTFTSTLSIGRVSSTKKKIL